MKEGAWINSKTGQFAWIDEHASYMQKEDQAKALGLPAPVYEKIKGMNWDFNGTGREQILAEVMKAGFIRMRGHGNYWTFEFTMRSGDALWSCLEFLVNFAGPYTTCRFNNLRTGETIEMPYSTFVKEMEESPERVLRVAKVLTAEEYSDSRRTHFAGGFSRVMQIMKGMVPKVSTFGIMSVDNPQNKPLPEPENQKRRDSFKKVLQNAQYGYVQHNGVYDRMEKAFFIMNVRLQDMITWCDQNHYSQESFIYGEVDKEKKSVTFTLYYGTTPGPTRTVVLGMDDNAENYYSELKGRKFVIPFFDDDYAPTDKTASNMPLGVPFEGPEVEAFPENAPHLAVIYAGNDALTLDAQGKTAGMSNYHKRGQLLQAVRNLRVR